MVHRALWMIIAVACGCAQYSKLEHSTSTPMTPHLFRVIVPVGDIQRAEHFYARVLGLAGERVSPGRHYFDCGGTLLACFDPRADGDDFDATPNPDHIYFAVDDLDATYERCRQAEPRRLDAEIAVQPWGERSFYVTDPFGNRLCFVARETVFSGKK